MSRPTLLLSSADIRGLMKPADYFRAVEAGFLAFKQGRTLSPAPMLIPVPKGGFHAKGAYFVSDCGYVALKLNGNLPGNPERTGLPTIQGGILLCDAETGSFLAVLDSAEVTLMRTAAASAVAASRLAREDSRTLLICGCGQQALPHAVALADVLPLRKILAWDIDASKSARFADEVRSRLGIDAQATHHLKDVALQADAIVTCTTSKSAFLTPDHVAPGAFIAAVGADSDGKSEITPALMEKAKIVVDVLEQCLAMGDLRLAIASSAVSSSDVHGDLGDVIRGAKPGRTHDDEIIIFDSTGTAIEDVASAAVIYERAMASRVGAPFVFAPA